jgi:LPXTG-motif cell wall-anchored protein
VDWSPSFNILEWQNPDGGWSFLPGASSADMTAMALAALAPYRDDPDVEAAIQSALVTLKTLQLVHGGFESSWSPDEIDVSSTAMVIIALSALGIDAQTWTVGDQASANPLAALLSRANASLDGFLYNGETNALATEQGFRALAAYRGFISSGTAYNIYIQAASGVASPASGGEGSSEKTLPATGDDFPALLAGVATLGLLALASGAVLRRRATTNNEVDRI